MDAYVWFWLAIITGIIIIGANDALCTYWKYKYTSNKKNETVKNKSGGKAHYFRIFKKMNN